MSRHRRIHVWLLGSLALAVACTNRSPSPDSKMTVTQARDQDSREAPRQEAAVQAAPAGPPASTEARIAAIRALLIAEGWKDGNFNVVEDGPVIGAWQTFMAFTTNPSGTLVDVWAGPGADRDGGDIIMAGRPLRRAQLRALAGQGASLRDVAHIVVRTAGHDTDLGDPQSGSSKGAPGALEGKLRAPAVDGDVFVFDARTKSGGYVRVKAPFGGAGEVVLAIEPLL